MSDTAPILFEEISTANSFRIGVATLNSPSTLNSLTFEMILPLQKQLEAWAQDPHIALIFLRGMGEKAFCAGGDIRRLYTSITTHQLSGADDFFYHEYRLDHWIHVCPKPILVWGHGIVMGGGMGLFAGAHSRIVTETTKIAMPEISIGLFPDVGATYFLSRMPHRLGLFLALSAARVNAADAKSLKLADFSLPHASQATVLKKLSEKSWSLILASNSDLVRETLQELATDTGLPPAEIYPRREQIEKAMAGNTIQEVAQNFAAAAAADLWFERAYQTFRKGSPTSAAVIFTQLERGRELSLAEVFQREFEMAAQFARHPDLPEGIRALLIEKDNSPHWQPASLDAVSPLHVESHFTCPWKERKKLL